MGPVFILAALRITGETEGTPAFSKPRNQSQAGVGGISSFRVFPGAFMCSQREACVWARAGRRWGLDLERGGCRGPSPDDTSVSMLRSLHFGVTGIHKIQCALYKESCGHIGARMAKAYGGGPAAIWENRDGSGQRR